MKQSTGRRALATGQRHAMKTAALGVVAGEVIARRGLLAAGGDHREAGRMVSEKISAGMASGMVVMQHAMTLAFRMGSFGLSEYFSLARSMQAVAIAPSVDAAWRAQIAMLQAAWPRWQDQSRIVGTALTVSGTAALVPVHRTAAANARRLGR